MAVVNFDGPGSVEAKDQKLRGERLNLTNSEQEQLLVCCERSHLRPPHITNRYRERCKDLSRVSVTDSQSWNRLSRGYAFQSADEHQYVSWNIVSLSCWQRGFVAPWEIKLKAGVIVSHRRDMV